MKRPYFPHMLGKNLIESPHKNTKLPHYGPGSPRSGKPMTHALTINLKYCELPKVHIFKFFDKKKPYNSSFLCGHCMEMGIYQDSFCNIH